MDGHRVPSTHRIPLTGPLTVATRRYASEHAPEVHAAGDALLSGGVDLGEIDEALELPEVGSAHQPWLGRCVGHVPSRRGTRRPGRYVPTSTASPVATTGCVATSFRQPDDRSRCRFAARRDAGHQPTLHRPRCRHRHRAGPPRRRGPVHRQVGPGRAAQRLPVPAAKVTPRTPETTPARTRRSCVPARSLTSTSNSPRAFTGADRTSARSSYWSRQSAIRLNAREGRLCIGV